MNKNKIREASMTCDKCGAALVTTEWSEYVSDVFSIFGPARNAEIDSKPRRLCLAMPRPRSIVRFWKKCFRH